MDQRLFRIATKVATPISLASLCVIAVYLIYQGIIGLHIFGDLTGDQTSQLINNIANKIFYLAVLLSVLGISSYLYTKGLTVPGQRTGPHMITGNVLTESGLPVTGAVVFVEGVDRRRITDENGWFQIHIEHRALLIVRAYLGDRMACAEVKRSKLAEPVTLILPPSLGSHEPSQRESCPDSKQEPASLNSKQKPTSNSNKTLYCHFCGKSQHEVRKLIMAHEQESLTICDECTDLCVDIIDQSDLVTQATYINELCENHLETG